MAMSGLFCVTLFIVSYFSYDLKLLGILKMVTLSDFFMCFVKDVVRRIFVKLHHRDRRSAYAGNPGVSHCPSLAIIPWGSFVYSLSCSFQRMRWPGLGNAFAMLLTLGYTIISKAHFRSRNASSFMHSTKCHKHSRWNFLLTSYPTRKSGCSLHSVGSSYFVRLYALA